MAKVHSRVRKPEKKGEGLRSQRTFPAAKQTSLAAIKTAGDLTELLNETNVAQVDVDDLLSEIVEEEYGELEDGVESELPDNDDLREEHDESEDDYTDYDEIEAYDPFEVEDLEKKSSPIYIASVLFIQEKPIVEFLQVPYYDTKDILVRNTLEERLSLFNEMATFIAAAQKSYFKTKGKGSVGFLKQQDLVEFLKKKHSVSKEHISRMLDALYFKFEGVGTIPSKAFFKRLTQDEKIIFAKEFLEQSDKNLSQLQKAKGLVKFIDQKTGISIKLSDNKNEHDKYKQYINIVRKVEVAKK